MEDDVQSAVSSRGFLDMTEMLLLLPLFAAFFAANQRSVQLVMHVGCMLVRKSPYFPT